MMNNQQNILGLDVGGRLIGVSVFKGEELVFYVVKKFRSGDREDSLRRLKKIIGELVANYNISTVAIEKIVFVQQHRSFVKTVYEKASNFLKEKGVAVIEYNPKLVRQIICKVEKPTKHNTALILAQSYAELVRYFSVQKLWQKRYYAQLFDAIAVGVVCAGQVREEGDR